MKNDYRYVIELLPEEEGGGFFAYYPTLGKWSINGSGDTVEETLALLEDCRKGIFKFWQETNTQIPPPGSFDLNLSGLTAEPDFDYAA